MKVTVIGSHLCPDTLYALNRLSEAKAEIDFKNISASLADLKVYLGLRQDSPVYADVQSLKGGEATFPSSACLLGEAVIPETRVQIWRGLCSVQTDCG